VDFYFCPEALRGFLESAGFAVGVIIEKEPYPKVEHQSRRA
jgi:hypothetical protein